MARAAALGTPRRMRPLPGLPCPPASCATALDGGGGHGREGFEKGTGGPALVSEKGGAGMLAVSLWLVNCHHCEAFKPDSVQQKAVECVSTASDKEQHAYTQKISCSPTPRVKSIQKIAHCKPSSKRAVRHRR